MLWTNYLKLPPAVRLRLLVISSVAVRVVDAEGSLAEVVVQLTGFFQPENAAVHSDLGVLFPAFSPQLFYLYRPDFLIFGIS